MNLFTKQKQTHRLRQKFMVTRDKGWAEGIVREFGINMYTLLYLKWITNISQSVQLLSHVRLFVTLWTAAHQAFLSFTISWSLLKLMSIESVTQLPLLCYPFSPALSLSHHHGLFQ